MHLRPGPGRIADLSKVTVVRGQPDADVAYPVEVCLAVVIDIDLLDAPSSLADRAQYRAEGAVAPVVLALDHGRPRRRPDEDRGRDPQDYEDEQDGARADQYGDVRPGAGR